MLFPATASAGRLIATGHDADHHCGRADAVAGAHEQCHFFQVAVNYVRAGAPDPTKPVLVLDRGALDVVSSLDRAFGPGLPRAVIDPRSPAFRAAPITTGLYSAVIIASSRGPANDPSPQDLNEFGSTPDSDAINVRAGDLRTFYGGGGGIYVNSGNTHGDDPTDPYYAFLPVTVRGSRVKSPFVLTDAGRALGMVDNDVVCCPTHNTIEPPADGSPFRTIDTDSLGRIVSVYAESQRFSGLGDHVRPRITALRVRPRRLKRGKALPKLGVNTGRRITFTLSEDATVTLKFERRTTGRRVGGKCRRTTSANRGRSKCTRYVASGTLKRDVNKGASSLRFQGRLSASKRLALGRYRISATAKDAAGNAQTHTRRKTFRLVKR